MAVEVKICGLKTRDDVLAADEAGADFIGFMFYAPSPRDISPELAGEISAGIEAKKVAVVVDADDELLREICTHLKPDFIQLHGKETEARAAEIKANFGVKLIRATTVDAAASNSDLYEYLLLDSPGGGTGKQFDYDKLQAPETPWFLGGGLTPENVADAIRQTSAKMVDVSSGVESSRGVKDARLIREFIARAKGL